MFDCSMKWSVTWLIIRASNPAKTCTHVKRIASIFNRLEKAGTHAEDALLLVILISMILLAGTQIVLRNFLDTSIFWGDEMLRLMVLWLTIAGGLAASRMDKHISIAVAGPLPASKGPANHQGHNRYIHGIHLCFVCLAQWPFCHGLIRVWRYIDDEIYPPGLCRSSCLSVLP